MSELLCLADLLNYIHQNMNNNFGIDLLKKIENIVFKVEI